MIIIMNLFINFLFFLFGMYVMKTIIKSIEDKKAKKEKDKQTLPFKELLSYFKKDLILFNKRIYNTIYFRINNTATDIAFNLDKGTISIFIGDECIAVSTLINLELRDELFLEMRKFSSIYNDVEMYGNVIISKNLNPNNIKKQKKTTINKVLYNIDDILDKINREGIDRLTNDEIDYLNKYGKK